MSKKLSILILTNNKRPKSFEKALNSALEVEYRAEIIVLNNGSEMNTEKWHKRIRYYHEEGLGLTDSYAKLISLAKGRYSMFLEDDDCLFPDMIKFLCDEAKSEVILCNASFNDRVNKKMGLLDLWDSKKYKAKDFISCMHNYDRKAEFQLGMLMFRTYLGKKIDFPDSNIICMDEYFLYRLLCLAKRVQTYSLTGFIIGINGDNISWNNPENMQENGYQHITMAYPYIKEKYPDIAVDWRDRLTSIYRNRLLFQDL